MNILGTYLDVHIRVTQEQFSNKIAFTIRHRLKSLLWHSGWKNISQRVTLSSQGKTWATAWRSWWGNTLLKLFNPYVETSLSLSNNYVETTLYFLTIMHFHISYLFLSLENAHRQLNDHESHSNWIESQIKEQITLIMFSGAFCARFFSQPSQISSCGVSGMHQIGYWSKWKSHNRHFLISHLSLLRYIYLQFSFWTSHLRFMPKSCLRRPRGSEPTTRNFRGSLCWELR